MIVDQLTNLINSKPFKAYMTCLEKGNNAKVTRLKTLLQTLMQQVDEIKMLGKSPKDIDTMFDKTIDLLRTAKEILKLESDKHLLHYGVKQCSTELVNLTILKNKIHLDNLDKAERSMQQIKSSLHKPKPSKKSK